MRPRWPSRHLTYQNMSHHLASGAHGFAHQEQLVVAMLRSSFRNPALRKRASQFTRLVRHSAVTPRTGQTHKPQLVTNGQLGVTFIGHSSFFLQMGGMNVVIDPNFARWLFVLKRLRQPGLHLRDLPPMLTSITSTASRCARLRGRRGGKLEARPR